MQARTFITYSRSGHYTATVRVQRDDGRQFKASRGKLASVQHARAAAADLLPTVMQRAADAPPRASA